MSAIHIALSEAPGVIRESTRTTLSARGFVICDRDGFPLRGEDLEKALRELGNNTAQALVSIDTNPENA